MTTIVPTVIGTSSEALSDREKELLQECVNQAQEGDFTLFEHIRDIYGLTLGDIGIETRQVTAVIHLYLQHNQPIPPETMKEFQRRLGQQAEHLLSGAYYDTVGLDDDEDDAIWGDTPWKVISHEANVSQS